MRRACAAKFFSHLHARRADRSRISIIRENNFLIRNSGLSYSRWERMKRSNGKGVTAFNTEASQQARTAQILWRCKGKKQWPRVSPWSLLSIPKPLNRLALRRFSGAVRGKTGRYIQYAKRKVDVSLRIPVSSLAASICTSYNKPTLAKTKLCGDTWKCVHIASTKQSRQRSNRLSGFVLTCWQNGFLYINTSHHVGSVWLAWSYPFARRDVCRKMMSPWVCEIVHALLRHRNRETYELSKPQPTQKTFSLNTD